MSDVKLFNGDCLEVMDKLIADGVKVDAVITDPPYELTPHGGGSQSLANRSSKIRDEIEFIANGFDYEKVFELMLDLCKIPNLLIFCSNLQLGKTITYFENKGLKVDTLIWEKDNPAPLCNGKYVSDVEFCVYVHTKGSPWNYDAPFEIKKKTKHYSIVTNAKEKYHPTQKPTRLMEELVELHTLSQGVVLDCFMGSGSTGVACRNLNRNFIGIELDENYFNIAKQRIENGFVQEEIKEDELGGLFE